MSTTFDGQTLIRPQARTRFNTSALVPNLPVPPSPHRTVLVGPATGGPNSLVDITTLNDITSQLDSTSDLAEAAALALRYGATPLSVWNVNPTTQATLTAPASSGSAAAISGTTTLWGTPANQIALSLATGTTAGYQASVFNGNTGQEISANNLALTPATVAYTGSTLTDVTITVTDTSASVSAGATPSAVFSVSFADYPTVAQAVAYINQQAGFAATVTDPNPNDPTTALFDSVTAVAVTSGGVSLTANVTAVVNWLNSGAQPWLTATRGTNPPGLATPGTYTYAAGGTTGAAATSDWQAAYTGLQNEPDVLWVAPITTSSSYWAMNTAHCQFMHQLGFGRSGIVGGSLDTTVANAISAAASLNSRYAAYLVQGVTDTNLAGVVTTFAPNVALGAILGLQSSLPLDQSLTNKTLRTAQGLDQRFSPPVQDQLIQAGCLVLNDTRGVVSVVKGQTTAAVSPTATADAVQWSAVNETFVAEARMNATMQAFVGKPITSTTVAAQVQHAILLTLQTLATAPHAILFAAPTLAQIVVTITGTVITATAPASPVLPADFVTVMLSASVDTAAA